MGKPRPLHRKLPEQTDGGILPNYEDGKIRTARAALEAMMAKGMLANPDEMLSRLIDAHKANDPEMTERKLLLMFAVVTFEMIQSVPYGGALDQVRTVPAESLVEPSYRALLAEIWRVQLSFPEEAG